MEHKFALNLASRVEDKLCSPSFLFAIRHSSQDFFLALSTSSAALVRLSNASKLPLITKRQPNCFLPSSHAEHIVNLKQAHATDSSITKLLTLSDCSEKKTNKHSTMMHILDVLYTDSTENDTKESFGHSFDIDGHSYMTSFCSSQVIRDFCILQNGSIVSCICSNESNLSLNMIDIEKENTINSIDYANCLNLDDKFHFKSHKNDRIFAGNLNDNNSAYLCANVGAVPSLLQHDTRNNEAKEVTRIKINGISNSLKVIRAFAQNPRHSNIIAIGGDSPSYFLYDLRNVSRPILEVCQHANSVVQLLFNCYFDQLILSTSVDGHAVVTNTNLDNYIKLPFEYSTLNVLNDLTYELADDCFLVNDVPLNPLMNSAWMENDPFKISIIDSDGIIGVHEMSQKHRNLMIDSVSKRSLEFTVLTTDSN